MSLDDAAHAREVHDSSYHKNHVAVNCSHLHIQIRYMVKAAHATILSTTQPGPNAMSVVVPVSGLALPWKPKRRHAWGCQLGVDPGKPLHGHAIAEPV